MAVEPAGRILNRSNTSFGRCRRTSMQMLVSRLYHGQIIRGLMLLQWSLPGSAIRELARQPERTGKTSAFLPQEDLITAAEDLELVACGAELLGELAGERRGCCRSEAPGHRILRVSLSVYSNALP